MELHLSGTIIMGHPNPGLKHPQTRKTGLGTWAESFPKQRRGPNLDARHLFRYGKPKSRSAHSPALRYGPSEASLSVEPSPPRSRVPRRDPSKRGQSPPRSRPLQPSPPRGLGTGEIPPCSRPPSTDWGGDPTTRRDGAHLLANHSTTWGGSRMVLGGVS